MSVILTTTEASSIGATLDIHSVPGQGTSITCVLDPTINQTRPKPKEKDRERDDPTDQNALHSQTPPVRELSKTGGSRR